MKSLRPSETIRGSDSLACVCATNWAMKLSILHLSDLHRDPENPIRNDVLLDSLENDRRRYSSDEAPTIQRPNLIIASGDIVQGVGHDDPNAGAKLREQYKEA